MALITLEKVSKSHSQWLGMKKIPALVEVDCNFEPAKFYHFAGHLGSGKTSLGRILVELSQPDSGRVIRTRKPKPGLTIGYMPEDIILPQRMKVAECLKYFTGLRGFPSQPKAPASLSLPSLVKRLELDRFAASPIEATPVGLRRRLQFTIAVANAPDLVVLDEPLYAFDELAHVETLAILRELKIAGSSIIALSGELADFSDLSDLSLILRNHKIVWRSDDGDNKSAQNPLHEIELSGASAEMIAKMQSSHQLPSPVLNRQNGFQQRLRFDDYEKALSWLNASVASGIIVTRFEEIPPDSPRHLDQLLIPEGNHA